MAYNKKQAEEEYVKRTYNLFKKYEKNIDELLVLNFEQLREQGIARISIGDIIIGTTDTTAIGDQYFPEHYQDALVALIKDRYSDWKVSVSDDDKYLKFHYSKKEESLLTLFRNADDRFGNIDLNPVDAIDKPIPSGIAGLDEKEDDGDWDSNYNPYEAEAKEAEDDCPF